MDDGFARSGAKCIGKCVVKWQYCGPARAAAAGAARIRQENLRHRMRPRCQVSRTVWRTEPVIPRSSPKPQKSKSRGSRRVNERAAQMALLCLIFKRFGRLTSCQRLVTCARPVCVPRPSRAAFCYRSGAFARGSVGRDIRTSCASPPSAIASSRSRRAAAVARSVHHILAAIAAARRAPKGLNLR